MLKPLHILLSGSMVLFGAFSPTIQAQTTRACDSYISDAVVQDILGKPVPPRSGVSQYGKDQNLEWHSCDWIGYYPPVAPGAPSNPAMLSVSVQRYATAEVMRKSQLRPQELPPKVKHEQIAKFGEMGAVYTNVERNTIVAVGSKGTQTVSVTVDMGLNPIRVNARKSIESILEKLRNEL